MQATAIKEMQVKKTVFKAFLKGYNKHRPSMLKPIRPINVTFHQQTKIKKHSLQL